MKHYVIYFFCLVLLASCVSQKKIIYLQSDDSNAKQESLLGKKRDTRIEPFDQLYITINSLDQAGFNPFKQDNGNMNSFTDAALSVLGYTVNDSGVVSLPFIGTIKLQGYTLVEAAMIIQNACKRILNNPAVSVRFVNNSITILGEVQRPGTYNYTKDQLSIFRAIGYAGDITEYGDRKNILLIREKGKMIYKYRLDLTNNDIITSDFYYLRPSDVIYVEPLWRRRWGVKVFQDLPFNLVFTGLTTVITTYLLYKSLK